MATMMKQNVASQDQPVTAETRPERTLDTLVLDLLEYVASEPRSYRATMEAWRTACPRLAVWEEAMIRGYVSRAPLRGVEAVRLTPAGRTFLVRAGRKG